MEEKKITSAVDSWGKLRFSIIGGLLSSPPGRGELAGELKKLAEKQWKHPHEDELVCFDWTTIERWYYQARNAEDPLVALSRNVRSDYRKSRVLHPELVAILRGQYSDHPNWSYQLHSDNLAAYVKEHPGLGKAPSYSTVKREMKARGWFRKKALSRNATPGQKAAYERREKWEIRSYESPYVHGLWHLDFHESRRQVVDAKGNLHTPKVFCVMDDRSRVCCHLQWYLSESAQALIHGLSQAFYKRGLPRSLMSDNGSAMKAEETRNGLERLGVIHELTLAYSPYQNGKQETFWGHLEGRLMKMLENVEPLTLDLLNRASQAWVELEYNCHHHREIGTSPIKRMLKENSLSRPAPDSETLKLAFCKQKNCVQRRSDGTIQIANVRFEIPSRFRHISKITVRYQTWDLSTVHMVDPRTGILITRLCPLDKTKNADGIRRVLDNFTEPLPRPKTGNAIPPLLRQYLSEYAATGLPPGYLNLDETKKGESK